MSRITISRRLLYNVAILVVVSVLLAIWAVQSNVRGTAQAHTLLETISTILALFIGIASLLRYYSRKDGTILLVGVGFLGAGILDGYHTLVTSSFFVDYFRDISSNLLVWSWLSSRLFLSFSLFSSWVVWYRQDRFELNERYVYLLGTGLTLLSFIAFVTLPLPKALYSTYFFNRPYELLPALFFALALWGYWRKGDWQNNRFEFWLLFSLAIGLINQVGFISFSRQLFDPFFFAGHWLKIGSYLFLYVGVLSSLFEAFQQVEASSIVLKETNKHLEIEMARRQKVVQDLEIAKEDAELATVAKGRFLANMSHEIRTPLNGVIGMTSVLLDSELSADQQDAIETIRTSGSTLLSLINDILDFSKIEEESLELEEIPFLLEQVVSEAIDLLSIQAMQKDIYLTYKMDSNIPTVIWGDITRLRQILVNLIGNGVKFTDNGGVDVLVSGEQIEAGVSDEWVLKFAVRDTGLGIPADKMDRLFHEFSQVDASMTRKYGGTGLGLAISQQLVKLMGGEMWVESDGVVGRGSRFNFSINCREGESSDLVEESAELVLDGNMGKNEPLRILLVDDNQVNQKVGSRLLEKLGYRADVATNGLEALLALRRQQYDLILLDIQMPIMDGEEAAKRINEEWSGKKRPTIVAMTAHALKGDRERFLSLGMDDYVSKPISLRQLGQAILRTAEKRKGVLQKNRANLSTIEKRGLEELVPDTNETIFEKEDEVNGIDPDLFEKLNVTMGDSLVDLIEIFLEDSEQIIIEIELAVQEQDLKKANRAAHTFKGNARTMGAVLLGEHCFLLEKCDEAELQDQGEALLIQIKEEYGKVSHYLNGYLADH